MSRTERRGPQEEGALLLLVMVAAAVMVIGISVGAQAWSSTWRRDSEDELIFRANQYVDALLAFQKEHAGALPVGLDELAKIGPMQHRYIRKLFRDPINPKGQWGLLYLMPGGQAIYDPVAAQKGTSATPGADASATASPGGAMATVGSRPGITPISQFTMGMQGGMPGGAMGMGGMANGAMVPPGLLGKGVSPGMGLGGQQAFGGQSGTPVMGGPGGMQGGVAAMSMMQGGGTPFSGALPPPKPATGTFDADAPSEPPIGWPIVGVISRVEGQRNDRTFKIFKGHDKVNEWQFHIFDRGVPQGQTTGLPTGGPAKPGFIGPGFGNNGPLGGIGDGTQPFGGLGGYGRGGGGRGGGGRVGTPIDGGPGPGQGGNRNPNSQNGGN